MLGAAVNVVNVDDVAGKCVSVGICTTGTQVLTCHAACGV